MAKYFYRIEHTESAIGPYNHHVDPDQLSEDSAWYWFLGDIPFSYIMQEELGHSFSGEYHMNPRHDGLSPYMNDDSRFGFASLEKVRRWFGTDKKTYDLFESYGFQLRRFKVEERFDSARQSVAMVDQMEDFDVVCFSKVCPNFLDSAPFC